MDISPQTLLSWVDTVGWALLHFLWQGALVGVAYAAMRPLCRSVGARYWCGMACLAAMFVSPAATLVYLWPSHVAQAASTAAVALPGMVVGGAGAIGGASLEAWLPWLVGAWFVGASTIGLRAFLHWRRLSWLAHHATVALPDCALVLERLRRRFGITRPIRLFGSAGVATPMLVGWLRPVILLPIGMLSGFTPQQIELIIAHELGHVRRWDYLANVLQVVIETVLFYHPVVHWISRDVRDARESCCDDLVLSLAEGSPVVYANTLADLEQLRHDGLVAPALAASGGVLLDRIRRIVGAQAALHDPLPRNGGWPIVLLVALGMLAALRLHGPSTALDATLLRAPAENIAAITGNPRLLAPMQVAAPTAAPTAAAPAAASVASPAKTLPAAPKSEAAVAPEPESDPIQQVARPRIAVVASAAAPQHVADIRARLGQIQPLAAPAESGPARNLPVVLQRVQPDYPLHEKLRGIGGDVQLEFAIGPDGSAQDIRVVQSVPSRVFDRVAISALKQWRFAVPAQAAGRYTQDFAFAMEAPAGTADACREVIGSHICRHVAAGEEGDR